MTFKNQLKHPLITQVQSGLEMLDFVDDTFVAKRDGQRQASVLMPLVYRNEDWHVLLTRRPKHMKNHAGQISFPGGRTEKGEMPLEGALRETFEEVGIGSHDIHTLGRLPSFNAVSEFRVTPFVGVINPDAKIIPEPNEVEEAFEIPFTFFMDPSNHVERRIDYNGVQHILYDMPWPHKDNIQHDVWGMTAMMMYRLYQRAFT